VSLADLWFNKISAADFSAAETGGPRFLDSGTFENRPNMTDPTGRALPSPVHTNNLWNEDGYLAAARNYAKRGHVLLSYDIVGLSIPDQVRLGLELFAEVKDLKVVPDLILHVEKPDQIEQIAETLIFQQTETAILAIPLDDLPGGWAKRSIYIRQLREVLNKASPDKYIYLHLLGCIDPGSVAHFFWAGADIFDGTGWLQYYFTNDYHAYMFKDYELQTNGRRHSAILVKQMALSNIRLLEKLGSRLGNAALNAESQKFRVILERVSDVIKTFIR
jgi:hypothetical protein